MSDFRKYAVRVNDLAMETREAARKIEKEYQRAEAARVQYPQRGGMVTADYAVKSARAEADYQEAKEARRAWRNNKPAEIALKLADIRAELKAAIDDAFAADPAALDAPTLELLKSGILKPEEYQRLMNGNAGNPTMMRLIGRYADRDAAAVAEKNGIHDPAAMELRAVSYQAKNVGGDVYLQNFDVLSDVLTRSVRSGAMWDQWEALTGEIIEQGF